MQNRISWIFEEGDKYANNVNSLNTEFENISNHDAPLVIPSALLGIMTAAEWEKMQEIYQAAYERTQSQEKQRKSEAERFERLLEGVGTHEVSDEY